MAIRVVRLGSPRMRGEGLRIGTVRRPPRGVPKARWAKDDWFDVWFPVLAPSLEIMKLARSASSDREWSTFARKYRAEMDRPEARHALELLAALSHGAQLSVGCYCEREDRCHRSILKELLAATGAEISPPMAPGSASGRRPRHGR